MTDTPKVLWDKCLLLIKENVSEQQFNAWFKPIAFESFNEAGRALILQVPSNFFVEYLEENYVGLLNKVLTKYFGTGLRLSYRIMVDKTHDLTQRIEPEPVADIDKTTKRTTRINQSPSTLDAAVPQDIDSQLDPRHTFSNYIEGDSNKLPRSVGLSIAEHPKSTQFNPMFIYGPSGCGKTHLINAIGVRTKELYPQKRVLYVSARLFQVQYTDSVLKNCTNDFINFYQTIDMLIVDDIQEWVSAARTQETFFHIFNHLFRNGKRIILACDRPPVDLQGMSDRLLTRFSCGLIAELEKPNIQLCIDILNSKIKRDGLSIPSEVVEFIAQTANGSVRDLEGVVISIMAHATIYNKEVDLDLAQRIVKKISRNESKPVTIDNIINTVCAHYGLEPSMIHTKSRKRDVVQARQIAMYLAKNNTDYSASKIGTLIGGKDHATVLHACKTIRELREVDKAFRADVDEIQAALKN